jgi:ADP-ribosylglycohydrolase
MDSLHEMRLARARVALEGLSVGDSIGGFFEFGRPSAVDHYIKGRRLPNPPWRFTDDTNMALSVFAILRQYGEIEQDALAMSFALHFDRARGYGMSVRALIPRLLSGQHWREVAAISHRGEGSFGNGGAMRVAPIGAYFADDFTALVENARLSAEVTHSHPEGIAGAIATAVGAGIAVQLRYNRESITRVEFLKQVLQHIPQSEVHEKIKQALKLPSSSTVTDAANLLGNGSNVSAQDTVPFALWCAGEKMTSFEAAIWTTASVGGDVDTTCAIVGGIVACNTGVEGIPQAWRESREALPDWAFEADRGN